MNTPQTVRIARWADQEDLDTVRSSGIDEAALLASLSSEDRDHCLGGVNLRRWPSRGRVVLAQQSNELFAEPAVLVYQAYCVEIGKFAVEHQKFIGCPRFSPTRMTWIKPNFLWMCYRAGWATKDANQHCILAIWLKRAAFERYLDAAVHSTFVEEVYGTKEAWQAALSRGPQKSVRLQWDPDHLPSGEKHSGRRAIQLGLRAMESFVSGEDILSIEDITQFVRTQGEHADDRSKWSELLTPSETVYVPTQPATCSRLGVADGSSAAKADADRTGTNHVPIENGRTLDTST